MVSSRKMCAGPALLSACRTPNCYVTVYIDGVKSFDASMGLSLAPDFGRMSPRDYSAAEFYASGADAPPQYNGTDQGCGVLVLWTRVR